MCRSDTLPAADGVREAATGLILPAPLPVLPAVPVPPAAPVPAHAPPRGVPDARSRIFSGTAFIRAESAWITKKPPLCKHTSGFARLDASQSAYDERQAKNDGFTIAK